MGILLEQGEELRVSLRKSLEEIDQTTGISKTMVLERENSRWALKAGHPLPKAFDEGLDDAKYQVVFAEALCEGGARMVSYISDNLSKCHFSVSAEGSPLRLSAKSGPIMKRPERSAAINGISRPMESR